MPYGRIDLYWLSCLHRCKVYACHLYWAYTDIFVQIQQLNLLAHHYLSPFNRVHTSSWGSIDIRFDLRSQIGVVGQGLRVRLLSLAHSCCYRWQLVIHNVLSQLTSKRLFPSLVGAALQGVAKSSYMSMQCRRQLRNNISSLCRGEQTLALTWRVDIFGCIIIDLAGPHNAKPATLKAGQPANGEAQAD